MSRDWDEKGHLRGSSTCLWTGEHSRTLVGQHAISVGFRTLLGNSKPQTEFLRYAKMTEHLGRFLAEKEALTRVLKISFLVECKNRMISIEQKEPIVVPFKDFRVEEWGDGARKIADIE
jgi:hypothetical protein